MRILNKNVTLRTARSREEWYNNRFHAVGASDVSTLFALNSFTNVVELFWNRVRLTPPTKHNINSYSGELHEDLIMKKYFVYYDPSNPTDEVLIANAEAKRPLRAVQRFRRGIFMNDVPLSCTLDYICAPDNFAPEGAIVECKNMLGHVVSRYESGILPGHILQVQAQLLCTGLSLGYLVYYVDGRFFRCFPIEANLDLQAQIIEAVNEFWNERVLPARKVWNDPMRKEQEKMLLIYDNFEPAIDPNSPDTVQEFMNVRFKDISKQGKLMATPEIESFIAGYREYRSKATGAETSKDQFGNELRSALVAHGCDEITNSSGKVLVSYRESSAGKLTLRVN